MSEGHDQPRPGWATTVVAAAVGTVAAATSSAAPTGDPRVDAVLVAAPVAIVAGTAATAPWVLLVVAAVAAVATVGDLLWLGVAAMAAVLGLIAGWTRRDQQVLCCGAAGLTLVALANSQLGTRFGLSAVVAGVVALALLVGGLRRRPAAFRRRMRRAIVGVVVGTGVAVGLMGVAAWSSRVALTDGRAHAEAALRAVRAGDYEAAAADFAAAAELFGDASEQLDRPWTVPAAVVPVLAQHRRVAVGLSADGAAASRVAADALADFDVDRLRLEGGRIDIEAIGELAGPLADLDRALASMSATVGDGSSPWLLPQLDDALADLRVELDEAGVRLDDAALAVAAAPRMLGAEGEQRYLVVFTTPVEARALGFPGNYAELVATDGMLTMSGFGRVSVLEQAGSDLGLRLTEPVELLDEYGRFIVGSDNSVGTATWRNMTMSPDFPKVAEAMAGLYSQIIGAPVDGVLLVDPYVVAALVGYTGPVELPSTGVTLDQSNALDYILIGQYANDDKDDRIDALGEAADGVMVGLLSGALPDPVRLAEDLAPLVAAHRLLFWAADPDAAELTRRAGLDGALPERDGADGFVMTVANSSGSKIDYFLDRAVVYDAVTDEGGTTMSTLVATLTNTAPTSGYPDYVIGNVVGMPTGSSRLYVSFFSPLELRLATVDGEYREMTIGTEGEWNVYSTFVTIAAGEHATLELELGGRVDDPSRVVTWEQPLVRPADVTVSSRVATPTAPAS